MSVRKYQIFISSTFEDLKEERKAITEAILEEKHIPIGMELFSTSDTSQWEYIRKRILESDYYVLIIGHRYGSIDNTTDNNISYTEKEYDFAIENNIPIMSFVIDKSATVDSTKIETNGDKLEKLNSFKQKVQSKLCKFYNNKDALKSHFKTALNECIIENPRAGWVRADDLIVRNNMMKIDLEFMTSLFEHKFQTIELESLYSFYDITVDINNFTLENSTYNFNEMYHCINPSMLFEYYGKKHYDVIYITMKEIKEKIIFLLSNPNIKLDYNIIIHFNLYLSTYDSIIRWYGELNSINLESNEELTKMMIKMIKEAEKVEYKKSNLINSFITYFYCMNFIKEWIIEYKNIIKNIKKEN